MTNNKSKGSFTLLINGREIDLGSSLEKDNDEFATLIDESLKSSDIEDHDTEGGCQYGQADGPDDYIKDCECPKGWFE